MHLLPHYFILLISIYSKKKKKILSQCVPYGFTSSTYAKELKKNRDCNIHNSNLFSFPQHSKKPNRA